MTNIRRPTYITRGTILKLLSNEEAARDQHRGFTRLNSHMSMGLTTTCKEAHMRYAIMTWTADHDNARAGALFGVVDAARCDLLPMPGSDGHWDLYKTVDSSLLHMNDDVKTALAQRGYYLYGAVEDLISTKELDDNA